VQQSYQHIVKPLLSLLPKQHFVVICSMAGLSFPKGTALRLSAQKETKSFSEIKAGRICIGIHPICAARNIISLFSASPKFGLQNGPFEIVVKK